MGFVLMDLCVYSLPPLDLYYLLFAARGVASAMHVVKIGGLWMNDESLFFLAWFVFWVFAWLVFAFRVFVFFGLRTAENGPIGSKYRPKTAPEAPQRYPTGAPKGPQRWPKRVKKLKKCCKNHHFYFPSPRLSN